MTGASPTKRSLGQRLAAYFALLAIAVQCFIVQPHIDPIALAAPRAAAIAASGVTLPAVATVSHDQANHAAAGCVICQTALSGGHGLAQAALTAHTEHASLFVAAPLTEQQHLSATPSHAWQSRGPPQLI